MDHGRLYLAIDIEKGGDCPTRHPLLALGVCLGSAAGGVLEKKTWCLKPLPTQTMEDVCVTEFWAHHSDLLDRIQAAAADPAEGLNSFNEYLCGLHARFPAATFGILSNNPAYDIGTLDAVMCASFRDRPIRYLGDGKYRSISDPSEMVKGQNSKKKVYSWAMARAKADHWPENDAEFIYWTFIAAQRVAAQLLAGALLEDTDPEAT